MRSPRRAAKRSPFRLDVAKKADIERLFAGNQKRHFGRLDILVNNAGVYAFLPLENITAKGIFTGNSI